MYSSQDAETDCESTRFATGNIGEGQFRTASPRPYRRRPIGLEEDSPAGRGAKPQVETTSSELGRTRSRLQNKLPFHRATIGAAREFKRWCSSKAHLVAPVICYCLVLLLLRERTLSSDKEFESLPKLLRS